MIKFSKYQGLGNDFIVLDARSTPAIPWTAWREWTKDRSRRGLDIGADGVLLVTQPEDTLRMHVINADGSEPEMCGNGLRCVIAFAVQELGFTNNPLPIQTDAGVKHCHWEETEEHEFLVEVEMGPPAFSPTSVPMTSITNPVQHQGVAGLPDIHGVSMGNPHGVLFFDTPLDKEAMENIAKRLQGSLLFPEGVNIGFATTLSDTSLQLTVYERGCGFTLACGTGACAAVAAGTRIDALSVGAPIQVELPGGSLTVQVHEAGIRMKGPALKVYTGHAPGPSPESH